MKIAAIAILLLAGCGVIYCFLVPPHTFIIFHRPDGGTVSFSRWRIEFEGPPDYYATGGFNQFESYVSRLMEQSSKRRWVSIFTPGGVSPMEDYLAGNGDVPDASRLLAYPLAGNASEVSALAQRILEGLCGVSSTEPLNIRYSER